MVSRMVIFLLLGMSMGFAQAPRTLYVGPGHYSSFAELAPEVRSGDYIVVLPGVYPGGATLRDLYNVTITGSDSGRSVIEGGKEALHLIDPNLLRVENIVFRNQTENCVNVDDGGSYDTPARSVHFVGCRFEGISATGNNDLLKMSGVDRVVIYDCVFQNGSPEGSMIDLVGCHEVHIMSNIFSNAGSNAIQVKGGSELVLITRNRFLDGGKRAINIGGSTGLEYFRPLDAPYEAQHVTVFANLFRGGETAFAFVTASECCAAHNTILYPTKWVFRMLQETSDPRFIKCRSIAFSNNIIVLDDRAANPSINIGPGTQPEATYFASNMWYHSSNPQWLGPNLPTAEARMFLGIDPLLRDPANDDVALLPGSPAIGAGSSDMANFPILPSPSSVHPTFFYDLVGRQYACLFPRSIGAMEGCDPTPVESISPEVPCTLNVFPHPLADLSHIAVTGLDPGEVEWSLYSLDGRILQSGRQRVGADGHFTQVLDGRSLGAGLHVLHLRSASGQTFTRVLVK